MRLISTKDMGIEVDGQNILKDMAQAPSPDEDWINQIVPCFMGVKANALEFVSMARNMKPIQITALVNAWLVERRSAPSVIGVLCGNRSTIMASSTLGVMLELPGASAWIRNDQVHLP